MNTHANTQPRKRALVYSDPYWSKYGDKNGVNTTWTHHWGDVYKRLLLSSLSRRSKKIIGFFIPVDQSHRNVYDAKNRDGQL